MEESLIFIIAILLYFVPFYIAIIKGTGKLLIFLLNLIFGWTLVAWSLLIILALSLDKKPSIVID